MRYPDSRERQEGYNLRSAGRAGRRDGGCDAGTHRKPACSDAAFGEDVAGRFQPGAVRRGPRRLIGSDRARWSPADRRGAEVSSPDSAVTMPGPSV